MQIQTDKTGETLTVRMTGRLDADSAPDLEQVLKTSMAGVDRLIIDMTEAPYISSAGLRALLLGKKNLPADGTMVIRGANQIVMEVLEMTGINELMTFEP